MSTQQMLLVLLLLWSSETSILQNLRLYSNVNEQVPPVHINAIEQMSAKSIGELSSPVTTTNTGLTSTISSEENSGSDTIAEEIKNEVFVNDLLETAEEQAINNTNSTAPEHQQGPHYEMDWEFIDKDTIRVTFDLLYIPKSIFGHSGHPVPNNTKTTNIFATLSTKPSPRLQSITLLEYFVFIIRPYHSNREIVLKMEKLVVKNTTSRPFYHFSNALRLSSLNHHEKYSICIYYFETNSTTQDPDFVLCQDIINDYSKFSNLRTDPKHGLLFITTQYSIIIGLLVVLQSVYSMRKRRVTELIGHHLITTAQNIRTTLSSVSLVRQSFSSLDTVTEQQQQQQQQTTNGHTVQHEPTIIEEEAEKPYTITSPTIVISEPPRLASNGASSSDENEPFLKQQLPKNNHVHFLLGPGEASDDDEHDHETIETNTVLNSQVTSSSAEPYNDQTDALLSMAHILDSNKPWSRHNNNNRTSPV